MNKVSAKPLDPVTGPLTREEFQAAINAPHGDAADIIRKHDPLWGLPDDAEIEWEITFEREIREEGYATVKAKSKEEAEKKAAKLKDSEIDWDGGWDCDTGDITEVTPVHKTRKKK